MALLDGLGKKIAKTGQDMVQGTKDFTEITRLNGQISDEQKQMGQLFAALGRVYYDHCGGDAPPPMAEVCAQVNACQGRIAELQREIERIKGARHCPHCQGEVSPQAAFCGHCGAQMPQEAADVKTEAAVNRFCVGCGNALSPGAAFCTGCGQKVQ